MKNKNQLYKFFLKPVIDYLIAGISFIILLPVFITLTIILYILNNGKPFFLQARTGKGERVFKVIKFKTMNDRTDKNGNLLSDAERLTSFGKFVRNTSLDELPQLLNVLKGDMSLIGPRPFIAEYLPLYSATQRRRFLVKPGITGWAQVNGRNTITWTKKLEYDVWYSENISLLLDVKIIFKTIGKMLRSDGVNQSEGVTAERFNSYN